MDEQQVIDYLMEHPDFFTHNALLLADMEIPHDAGGAVSLIERQVSILRKKNKHFETKLREMVDAVHDNQRLNESLQRLAVNLIRADDLDDVLAIVNDELRNRLATDYVSIRLLTDDAEKVKAQPERYSLRNDPSLACFERSIHDRKIQCGRLTAEQIQALFSQDGEHIASGAILPLVDVSSFGIIGLASIDAQRYHPGMGTEFLRNLSDLVSAAIRAHLK
ncbi:MAG: DUF484 family protein [Gammaproteobacteria bacterium]|nr:MAG: DUF484 family protein [Gammaproteobacteria bacterium]